MTCLLHPSTVYDAERAACSYEEAIDLGASEIACAVADEWTRVRQDVGHIGSPAAVALCEGLHRLEAATRGSAMRKVRP